MLSLRTLLVAAFFVFSSLFASTASADDMTSAPGSDASVAPKRQRHDEAMFGWGLATAITGGVALNAGLATAFFSSVSCMFCTGEERRDSERMEDIGIGIAVGGLVLIAAGIPMAIIGGRKEPVVAPAANAGGLVPVFVF